MTENPRLNSEKKRVVAIDTANKLNGRLRNGAYVWNQEILRLLRKVPRPICVDVDGVLIDYYHTFAAGVEDDRVYSVAPNAIQAIQELRKVGTVVIVTGNNSSWDSRQQVFIELGLWDQDMVMIDAWNLRVGLSLEKRGYRFADPKTHEYTRTYYNLEQKRKDRIDEYLKKRGWTEGMFLENAGDRYGVKSLAAVFDKPYDIPIIDDTPFHTQTPGMRGLLVRTFIGGDYTTEQGITLPEAVGQVRLHYAKVI